MIMLDATPAELLDVYRHGPQILRDAVAGLTPDALRARPIAGKMSSLEVLCHIVDSDQFMCDRIKLSYHERDIDLDLRLLEIQRERELFHHAVEHLEDHVLRITEKRSAMGL